VPLAALCVISAVASSLRTETPGRWRERGAEIAPPAARSAWECACSALRRKSAQLRGCGARRPEQGALDQR
jgi:hypothetical protein